MSYQINDYILCNVIALSERIYRLIKLISNSIKTQIIYSKVIVSSDLIIDLIQ